MLGYTNKKQLAASIDPEKIKLSGGKLISILDYDVPEYVLNMLDKNIDYMINNFLPDANYDNNPIVSFSYQNKSMYRRWNMQMAPDYVEWRIPEFKNLESYLLRWASNIFNFKFIFSSPKTEIIWHEKHKTPRIHIPLQLKDTTFEILDEKEKNT